MSETPGVFEVADGEFACGVAAVVPVGFDRGQRAVRFPRVVTGLYRRQFGHFGVLFAAGLVAGVVLSGSRVGGAGRLLPRLGPGW